MIGTENITKQELRNVIDCRVQYHLEEIVKASDNKSIAYHVRKKICDDHRSKAKENVYLAFYFGVITVAQYVNISTTLDYMLEDVPAKYRFYMETPAYAY